MLILRRMGIFVIELEKEEVFYSIYGVKSTTFNP